MTDQTIKRLIRQWREHGDYINARYAPIGTGWHACAKDLEQQHARIDPRVMELVPVTADHEGTKP